MRTAPPLRTSPSYDHLTPWPLLPPSFEDRLLYYNSFDQPEGKPEVNAVEAVQVGQLAVGEGGMVGRCLAAVEGQALQLQSPSFSPHLPLTVSFWWALPRDLQLEDCFNLFHLDGGPGFVSHFSRGKGDWCALQRPAAVLQVWSLPDIANINGLYDFDLMAHLDLRANVWHHTALVFSGASLVQVYTDGSRAWEVRIAGRPFGEQDKLSNLTLGGRYALPVALDEVLVLRRALSAGAIGTYVEAVRQMREVGYF